MPLLRLMGACKWAVLLCAASLLPTAQGQTLPNDLKEWTLDFSITGGIAGLNRHLSLTNSGDLTIGPAMGTGSKFTTRAAADLMTTVTDYLKVAKPASPAPREPVPDAIHITLVVTSAGKKYPVEAPKEISSLFTTTMDTGLRKALLGSWWESEWKLCTPASQLTADEMDPPISELVLREDATFSVTWQGGGARAYAGGAAPHVPLQDYSGSFSTSPEHYYIQFNFGSGIYTPRDFEGSGHFQVTGDKLVLQNIWFGTRQAKRKPDICEMTFSRTSPKPGPSPSAKRKHR